MKVVRLWERESSYYEACPGSSAEIRETVSIDITDRSPASPIVTLQDGDQVDIHNVLTWGTLTMTTAQAEHVMHRLIKKLKPGMVLAQYD